MSSTCSDPAMAGFVAIVKNIMAIFQVIVPILLMISVALTIGKLVFSPDVDARDKNNGHRIILNKVIAAIVIFFLPYSLTMTINMVSSLVEDSSGSTGFSFVDCMRSANPSIFEWNPGG